MNDLDKNKKLAEILKLARLALNDEFIKSYADSHQAWQVACNQAWITKGILLPYSNKFVYPTEQEIVAKAVEIYNTLTPTEQAGLVANVPAPTPVIETSAKVDTVPVEQIIEAPVIEEPVIEEPVPDDTTVIEEVTEEVTEDKAPELESRFKSLFTKWGGRGSY